MVRLQSVHQQKPEKKYPIVTGKLVSGKSRKQATADLFLHKCFHQISSLSQKTCGRSNGRPYVFAFSRKNYFISHAKLRLPTEADFGRHKLLRSGQTTTEEITK